MIDGGTTFAAFALDALDALDHAMGRWVYLHSTTAAFSCLGCVVRVSPETGGVELKTISGGTRCTAVGLFAAVEVFGPAEQVKLEEQLAGNLTQAGGMWQ